MGENSFPRELRLLTPAHFESVFSDAIPASTPQLTLLARFNNQHAPRLGITLSKKRVKKANQRNRIKRCVRESFRTSQHELPPIDIIVVGKSGLDSLSNSEIHQLLKKQWKRLTKRCVQSQSV